MCGSRQAIAERADNAATGRFAASQVANPRPEHAAKDVETTCFGGRRAGEPYLEVVD